MAWLTPHFSNNDDVKKWIYEWIAAKEPAFFHDGIHQLPERWEKARRRVQTRKLESLSTLTDIRSSQLPIVSILRNN
ncbi:hypothetical protein LAZ67_16002582 [Cordylochernes scorpioides]|uniref:Mariner Mos1 transposase n=1 Tax=Cordylochernes scorpioides TaxID=51811 RepID=A0ABY6LC27_9ARAC|nr:hypothetical protein LAZ67_16002582 [Cordylochernes scorpioides]